MKVIELYDKLQANKHKIPIIDLIMDLHPGLGTDRGWSTYTGGFVDSGKWNLEKLLDVDVDVLRSQYEIWNVPPQPAGTGSIELEEELIKKWKQKFDEYLMWGK